MKLKQIIAGVLAPVVALSSSVLMPAYAEQTFATPASLIRSVLGVACTDVTNDSLDTAVESVVSQLSYTDGLVSYKGVDLGYWYSDDSAVLYADSARSTTVIEETLAGYTVEPEILSLLLTDVNSGISETYEPTSSDWSNIVGRYDITLGDVTIPASQWIKADSVEADIPITTGTTSGGINISNATGLRGEQVGRAYKDDCIFYFSWYVDSAGVLYIQDGLSMVYIADLGGSDPFLAWQGLTMATNGNAAGASLSTGYYGQLAADYPTLKLHLVHHNGAELDATKSSLMSVATMEYLDGASRIVYYRDKSVGSAMADVGKLRKYDDVAVINTEDVSNGKAYGIAYYYGRQCNATDQATLKTERVGMYNSHSTFKNVIGDSNLSKRIAKLSSIDSADTLEVQPTGWYINDTVSIDTFIASQQMLTAGDTADINAIAEIEPLCFNVVVPTTLPIYISAEGEVSTATNAVITNKSNASVKITAVNVEAKPESGWTLVQSDPSDVRDAKEFTFTTSLAANDIILRDAEQTFTYSAALSPMTAGTDSLDLATVSVTVDWAD